MSSSIAFPFHQDRHGRREGTISSGNLPIWIQTRTGTLQTPRMFLLSTFVYLILSLPPFAAFHTALAAYFLLFAWRIVFGQHLLLCQGVQVYRVSEMIFLLTTSLQRAAVSVSQRHVLPSLQIRPIPPTARRGHSRCRVYTQMKLPIRNMPSIRRVQASVRHLSLVAH